MIAEATRKEACTVLMQANGGSLSGSSNARFRRRGCRIQDLSQGHVPPAGLFVDRKERHGRDQRGAGIGFAQWLMLRRSLGVGLEWIVATSAGLALGLAIGAAVVGYETTTPGPHGSL